MTDKELKKLKRDELLEILLYMRKELDETKLENIELKKKLDEVQKGHLSKESIDKIMVAVEKIIASN